MIFVMSGQTEWHNMLQGQNTHQTSNHKRGAGAKATQRRRRAGFAGSICLFYRRGGGQEAQQGERQGRKVCWLHTNLRLTSVSMPGRCLVDAWPSKHVFIDTRTPNLTLSPCTCLPVLQGVLHLVFMDRRHRGALRLP